MKKPLLILMTVLGVICPLIAQNVTQKKFVAYDLVLSDLDNYVAAWQVEIVFDKKALNITGVEGGEGPFSEPADYDSQGLTGGRIILAAYTLEDGIQKSEVRLARLHAFEEADSLKKAEIKIMVLADSSGRAINGKVQLKAINE